MRKGSIEFRWSTANKSHELVKLQKGGTCYVIAFFRKTSEGYDMETVGDRFFEDADAWVVGKHAIQFLNAVFDSEDF